MLHFDVNWIAVLVATIASMALGMAWYMILSKQWMAATGKSEEALRGNRPAAEPFIVATICQLVMAYFLAALTPLLMGGELTIYGGILVGAHMWLGFIVTSMLLNHRYQNMSPKLTFIDGGYLLGVVIVQGVVLGLFGPVASVAN